MSRYIDADALKAKLMEYIGLTNGFERAFAEAPSIDLVRCKECKWHAPRATAIKGAKYCKLLSGWTRDNDFCSHGERAEQTEPKVETMSCQECKWWSPIKRKCTITEASECAYEPIPII